MNSIKLLQEKYLLKNIKGEIIETPLEMFRRVAHAIAKVDIAYKKDLNYMQKQNTNLQIIYSVDNAVTKNWKGETGFITEERVKKYKPDFKNTYYMMCGPIPFMNVVKEVLINNKVEKENIKKEVF